MVWCGRAATAAPALWLIAMAGLTGCQQPDLPDIDPTPAIERSSPPPYASTAARHNRLAAPAGPVSCEAVGTLRWTENGEAKMEQVEGRLFYGGPGRVHLAVRKLSQTLMILGSNQDGDGNGLYFAVDLRAKPRSMRIGSMDGPIEPAASLSAVASASGAIRSLTGLARALDDVLALCPLPLEPGTIGGTQWSTNGHLLGVTYCKTGRGGLTVRRWLSTDGLLTTLQTEVFAPGGGGVSGQTPASASILATTRVLGSGPLIGGAAAPPPVLPESLVISVEGREAVQIELRLGEIKAESKLDDDLFDPTVQASSLGVERVIDLDASRRPAKPLQPAQTIPDKLPAAAGAQRPLPTATPATQSPPAPRSPR